MRNSTRHKKRQFRRRGVLKIKKNIIVKMGKAITLGKRQNVINTSIRFFDLN